MPRGLLKYMSKDIYSRDAEYLEHFRNPEILEKGHNDIASAVKGFLKEKIYGKEEDKRHEDMAEPEKTQEQFSKSRTIKGRRDIEKKMLEEKY